MRRNALPVAAALLNDTVVSFLYKDGTVTPGSSRIVYGYHPDCGGVGSPLLMNGAVILPVLAAAGVAV